MGKAFGVYGPVMGLSAMLGPIAVSGLISANVLGTGWRMIFLVNVPVGLAALALGARTAARGREFRARRLDLPGALLAGAAMFLLVFPLAQGHSLGWLTWLFGMMAASVLVLAGFGWYQVRCSSARAATRWSSRPCSGTALHCGHRVLPSCSPGRWAAS